MGAAALLLLVGTCGCLEAPAARGGTSTSAAVRVEPELGETGAERPWNPHPPPSPAEERRRALAHPLPELERPELFVSLSRLELVVGDAASGFVRRFPIAAGKPDGRGRSRTPTGTFRTGPDPDDTWWYVPERSAGYPFVRLDARDPGGEQPYGLHGPKDGRFAPGLHTRGCIRLAGEHIFALHALLRRHPGTPVHIAAE